MFTALIYTPNTNVLRGAYKNYEPGIFINEIHLFTLSTDLALKTMPVNVGTGSIENYNIVADSIFYYEEISYLASYI